MAELCRTCKHYYSRNLSGGWSESGCTKHGWKPDGMGGSGKRLGDSWKACGGKDYEYVERRYRGNILPRPIGKFGAKNHTVKKKEIRIMKEISLGEPDRITVVSQKDAYHQMDMARRYHTAADSDALIKLTTKRVYGNVGNKKKKRNT